MLTKKFFQMHQKHHADIDEFFYLTQNDFRVSEAVNGKSTFQLRVLFGFRLCALTPLKFTVWIAIKYKVPGIAAMLGAGTFEKMQATSAKEISSVSFSVNCICASSISLSFST